MRSSIVKIGAGGRLVIPGDLREALGLRPGDQVVLVLENDGLRVLTPAHAVRRAQALVARHVPAGRSLSDELIAERREEARAERREEKRAKRRGEAQTNRRDDPRGKRREETGAS